MTQGSVLTLVADMSDLRLANLVRDLGRDLTRAGIEARAVQGATTPGERGDAAMLGQLALGLVTSGTIAALIGCLKAYISRSAR